MTKSKWEKYKEKNGVTPLSFLNPNTEFSGDKLSTERYSICQECPEFLKITNQCKQCGCFMNLKVKLAEAKCPIGKW